MEYDLHSVIYVKYMRVYIRSKGGRSGRNNLGNLKSLPGKLKLKLLTMFLTTPIIILSSAVCGVLGHARIDSPTPRLVSCLQSCYWYC